MKRIKWFQRSMIVLLVSINVLFYCIKTNVDSIYTVTFTCSAMLISLLGIFVYKKSSKRIARISISSKNEEENEAATNLNPPIG